MKGFQDNQVLYGSVGEIDGKVVKNKKFRRSRT
jgi:hypothetical protein